MGTSPFFEHPKVCGTDVLPLKIGHERKINPGKPEGWSAVRRFWKTRFPDWQCAERGTGEQAAPRVGANNGNSQSLNSPPFAGPLKSALGANRRLILRTKE